LAENKSSSRVFLFSSLVLGVLAMVIAFLFLQNTAGEERGPKVKILIAKHDLRENTAIDPDKDFDEMEISAQLTKLHSQALSAEYLASYKGMKLNRSVLAGTPIWKADMVQTTTLELKGDVRAMSISVRGSNALSGLVVPGDYVKLLVTKPIPATRPTTAPSSEDTPIYEFSQPTRYETALVAPTPFKVLAVNQRLSRVRAQVSAAEQYQATDANQQQSVTLEVTEAQAKVLLEQTNAGQLPITLLLCPPPTK
jgi:Flp pilus assembly protein CpaB